MNIFRLLGDLSHLVSILILLHKMRQTNSCSGISFKSQALYFIVYITRYLDIFTTFNKSAYNTIFKILFIASSGYTIYLMTTAYKPTHDPGLDTFRVQYILAGSFLLAIVWPYEYTFSEILWAFSIWLESVAIMPQLLMLQRTGEAETITTHYLFALGLYRALYIPNWIWRYWTEIDKNTHKPHFDGIAVLAGIIQTILYSDFFWIYYTKVMKGKKFALPV
ncbi:ER lumen protein retaining receptor [Amylocarpus encephaloides]|uniref:ER lumen protein-retaining receptor n=1 Tax=Amylocarpus encephaloides TaxID=45428 RepID=A0A9P7YG35_9HELO|nr:ER lumen protein retaining receptor [Amylocarpus encephaloides]